MDNRMSRLQAAQLQDVAEMKAILEAAAGGKDAAGACEAVLGKSFKLSGVVATGIERGEAVCM
ncbi:hypothetical protein [Paenibacillus sinopodophylli]|uniref:hypothetical protein n=1 Tax=Paenibacillus sinopodophylli TaxID=1837342 RepID=UPI00110CC8C8|nr:hypothetical protein [Paenibacillus sinopodophylli]